MREIFRTNDAVRLSWAEAILREAGLSPLILDTHASIVEGSIGAIPRRLMLPDEEEARGRRILADAEPEA